MSESEFEKHLFHTIRQTPGFAAWKKTDLTVGACNQSVAEYAGYDMDSIIGITDYDIKCDAVEYADMFRDQDRRVMSEGVAKNSIDILLYSDSKRHVMLSQKAPIYDMNGICLGVLYTASELDNHIFQSMIDKLISIDGKFYNKNRETAIYNVFEKKDLISHNLTQRESECLFYIIRGFTSRQISFFLNINKRTVESYIQNIKEKFNMRNKFQLIEYGINVGLLHLIPHSIFQKGLIYNYN